MDWQVDCGIRTLVFGKKGEVGGVLGGEGMLDSRRLEYIATRLIINKFMIL